MPLNFMVGSALFYIVVGAGGVMTVLLFIILVLCVAIGILASRKRRSYLIPQTNQPQTVRPAQGGERQVTAQNTQQSDAETVPANAQHPPRQQSHYTDVNEYDIVGAESGEDHTYAMVNETQIQPQHRLLNVSPPSLPNPTQLNPQAFTPSNELTHKPTQTEPPQVTLRRTKSFNEGLHRDNLSMSVNLTKKRPASWSSPLQDISRGEPSKVTPGNTKRKISRVYDSVSVPVAKATEGAVGGMQYNKLLHPGYPKRQPPKPHPQDPTLAAMYSKLGADRDKQNSTKQSPKNRDTANVRDESQSQNERGPGEMAQRAPQGIGNEFEDAPLYSNVSNEMALHKKLSRSGPIYSVPDMQKKKRGRLQKSHEQLDMIPADPFDQMLEMRDLQSLPLYSNLQEELGNISHTTSSKPRSGPVYSTPDMDKKRQLRKQQSDKQLTKETDQKQQVRPLPPEPMEESFSPMYSNLEEERALVQSMPGPAYHTTDWEPKLNRNHPRQASQRTDRVARHMHQDIPERELPPRHKTFSSTPLYSNMNAEMHPVREIRSTKGHQQPTAGPVYSVPDMKKKREGRQVKTNEQFVRQRRVSSPSPPPLPSPDITESMKMSFAFGESLYPHVSVPSHLRTIKPMPSETAGVSVYTVDHGLYDTPRRKDIYKPLPLQLEGVYDVPSGNPAQVLASVEEGLHYDLPSSLSRIPSTKGGGQGRDKSSKSQDSRSEQKSRRKN